MFELTDEADGVLVAPGRGADAQPQCRRSRTSGAAAFGRCHGRSVGAQRVRIIDASPRHRGGVGPTTCRAGP